MTVSVDRSGAPAPLTIRAPYAHWPALAIVFAALALPDCCLNGSHMYGLGMGALGPICRDRS
jgi:hypothetical protein